MTERFEVRSDTRGEFTERHSGFMTLALRNIDPAPDPDEMFAPALDLTEFVPKEVLPLANPQTDIPRIAKDERLTGLIDEAVHRIPTFHNIFLGDARRMEALKPESVHLVLTSPPYWTLKDYRDSEGQMGHIEDYEEFLVELDKVWSHCFRALVPGGRLVCVVYELSRVQTKIIAGNIIPRLQKEYELLIQTLKIKGLQRNSYSLFFALVLDGIVWHILEQNGVIKEKKITKEKPFWDGVMWMIEPKREFSCGTNSLSSGNLSICVNWSDNSGVSVLNYKMLRKMLNDYKENGRVINPEVFKTFEGNELFDKKGNLQIPIIKADSTDVIYSQSKSIANIIVQYLNNNIDYSKVLANYPNIEKDHAITILYHEIMWDILDIMERAGQIKKPAAFGKPNLAKPEDLKDLIFIVKD